MTATIIISALTGGLAGAVAANWFTIWRDRVGRLRAFRGYVRSVHFELRAINLKNLQRGQLFQRQQNTVQGIRAECARASEDVCNCRHSNFEAAWMAYCGLNQQQVEPGRQFDYENRTSTDFDPDYERGLETVEGLLQGIINHAK